MVKKIEIEGVKYEDLPLDTRKGIEKAVAYRKSLGLPDDTEDRKEKAIKYFIFQRDKR